jgi:hypothetical protein
MIEEGSFIEHPHHEGATILMSGTRMMAKFNKETQTYEVISFMDVGKEHA